MVAPMKTRLPAVEIAPPELGDPVLMPLSSSSGNEPSGTCHWMSPVFALTATSSPHGGCVQLHSLEISQKRSDAGVDFEYEGGAPPPAAAAPPRPPPPDG